MPTFPLARIVIRVEVDVPPVVEAIVKSGVLITVLRLFESDRREYGDVVPMPMLLFVARKRDDVAVRVVPELA